MLAWSIILTHEAAAEFRTLPEDMKGRFFYIGTRMKEVGPAGLGMPHVRFLGGKLWEMRLSGGDGIARGIYFTASERRVVVVRLFVKKTEKTPRREIEIARRRMENFDE